jgi:hypothetical protein
VIMVEQLVLWIRVQDQAYHMYLLCLSGECFVAAVLLYHVDEMPATICCKVKCLFTFCMSEKDKRLCGVLNGCRLWMDMTLGGRY